MVRKWRVEYPGAIYHVMSRGDRREQIFKDDSDRKCFLETLGECGFKVGWQVHAFVLMPNHFHLVAPSKRPVWLRVDRLLGEHGMGGDTSSGRKKLERQVEERRALEEDEDFKPIRRGWCLGGETFRQDLLERMSERLGREYFGEELSESALARAERLHLGSRHYANHLLWKAAKESYIVMLIT